MKKINKWACIFTEPKTGNTTVVINDWEKNLMARFIQRLGHLGVVAAAQRNALNPQSKTLNKGTPSQIRKLRKMGLIR